MMFQLYVPLFGFEIAARGTKFDCASFRVTFALETGLDQLDKKSEFVTRFDAEQSSWDCKCQGTAPVSNKVGGRNDIEGDAIRTGLKNWRDGASSLRLRQRHARGVR